MRRLVFIRIKIKALFIKVWLKATFYSLIKANYREKGAFMQDRFVIPPEQ
jgi:hypothetical protein